MKRTAVYVINFHTIINKKWLCNHIVSTPMYPVVQVEAFLPRHGHLKMKISSLLSFNRAAQPELRVKEQITALKTERGGCISS